MCLNSLNLISRTGPDSNPGWCTYQAGTMLSRQKIACLIALKASMGFGLVGIRWYLQCRTAFMQYRNPTGLGLKSLESRENGRDCVQESYRVGSFIWWHNFGKYSMSTEKTDVQNLTDKQIKTVSFEANAGQSTVWQHFTSTSCDWIATLHRSWNADDAVLKFKPRDGTKGLQTHLDYCDTVCLG